MDTLLELSAAFKKIIVGYKNIKLLQDNTIDNELESLDVCIKNTLKVNSSKESHLNLFHQVALFIDELDKVTMSKLDMDSLEKDLIVLIKTLYALNHDGYSHKCIFNTVPYTLTTTLHSGGFSWALSDLGILIKDFLLRPLGAADVLAAIAPNNIEIKIKSLFLNIAIKAQEQIKLSEMSKMQEQIALQEAVIQQQRNKIQDLEHQPDGVDENMRSQFSDKINTVTGGVASLLAGVFENTSEQTFAKASELATVANSQNIKKSKGFSNHANSTLLATSMQQGIFTSECKPNSSKDNDILKPVSSGASLL